MAGTLGVAEKRDEFAIQWVAFLGPSIIDVQANPASSASKSAAAVSIGSGAIFSRVADSRWNIGAFVGWDHIADGGGSASRYDCKVWYSIGR